MIQMLILFLTFLKIGALSLGGGYGMIPLLTDEVVSHGWMTETEVLNFIAVSESTPGPIAINMATFIGATLGGDVFAGSFFGKLLGAFFATFGVVLPSFVIILVIVALIKNLLKFKGVQAFLTGVRPVVTGLIVAMGITIFLTVIFSIQTVESAFSFDYKAFAIFGIIALTHILFKKIKKKSLSPIILIIISAILGIVFYGLIP